MRAQLRHRLGELIAAVAPAELRIGDIAAMAVGVAEIVRAWMQHPVELVVRLVLGQPVTLVLGEVEDLRHRMPIHADDLADALGDNLRVAAVEIDAA